MLELALCHSQIDFPIRLVLKSFIEKYGIRFNNVFILDGECSLGSLHSLYEVR